MVEENLKQYLGDIENYCKKYEAEQGYRLSAQDENAKKDKIIEKMKALGNIIKVTGLSNARNIMQNIDGRIHRLGHHQL